MLVIIGANGRTGIEILKAARALGWPVRPVVRDDHDARHLDRVVSVQEICYADPDHPASLPPVLVGATQVVSCINARTAGPGCPDYSPEAGANIVRACQAAHIPVLHLSVVGAYRWSPNPLNRASFRVDRNVRLIKDATWTMVRVSCYADEVIDGHVRPPDGGAPHPIEKATRYAPVSRRDVARMVVSYLPLMKPNRTLYLGGPEVFTGAQLEALVAPWRAPGTGRRTRYGQLPPGDVSVSPDTTRVMVDIPPEDHLRDLLNPAYSPPPPPARAPLAGRPDPGPHPADGGGDGPATRALGPTLRRVLTAQLLADLGRMGLPTAGATLDYAAAAARPGARATRVHQGALVEMTGIVARGPGGAPLHEGPVTFLHDALADELFVWFDRPGGIPQGVWDDLDMGVRRRLAKDPHFRGDPRCVAFSQGPEARPTP